METILFIVVFIFTGAIVGYLLKHNPKLLCLFDHVSEYAVYGLLILLGAQMGANETLLQQFPFFGGIALFIAVAASLGSLFCCYGAEKLFTWFRFDTREFTQPTGCAKLATQTSNAIGVGATKTALTASLFSSAKILFSFCAGIAGGYWHLFSTTFLATNCVTYMLWVLVFSVGVGLGGTLSVFLQVKSMGKRLLAVPLFIVVGTCAGAVCASFFIPALTLQENLSVAAGFGYYSLSSIIISETGREAVASIALLANILRETIGLLTAPMVSRLFGPLGPIAIAGATAMDVSLPMIARHSGPAFVIVAVFSGMLLSLLVPFMVTFILSW